MKMRKLKRKLQGKIHTKLTIRKLMRAFYDKSLTFSEVLKEHFRIREKYKHTRKAK
jgi:hypothetical protein